MEVENWFHLTAAVLILKHHRQRGIVDILRWQIVGFVSGQGGADFLFHV